jgi:hypothetical protein
LHLGQIVVVRELFFLQHVSGNDNRLEKIHGELASDEDKGYEKESSERVMIFNWDSVLVSSIYCLNHDIVPSLCRRNLVENERAVEHVVKTIFAIDPFTARINAFPFRLDRIK